MANSGERMANSDQRNTKERGPMSVQHCRHVKEDGAYCQGAPLRGREYCRFHLRALGRRMRIARAQARREPYRLLLPILEDLNAVQVARMQVLDALAAGLIEDRRAGLLLYGLQQASSDLRSATAAPTLGVYDESDTAERAEDYPGFEEEFDLPKDLDLAKPPEVVFPPAAATAVKVEPSPYRSKPFRWDEIGPEDVELEEIFRTQGPEAYQRREKEFTRQAMKEVMEHKQAIQRARYVVEAARRNEERLLGTPEERARNAAEIKRELAEVAAQRRAELEAAVAAMAAKKSQEAETAALTGDVAVAPAQGAEVDKKPAATATDDAGDAMSQPQKKSGTE